MKLFHMPGTCSQAIYITLTELGIPCEISIVTKTNRDELLKYNPRGQVPTLVLDNGQVLTEGAVIQSYLCDLKAEMNLMPKAGTWERYKTQEALNYVATELHKGIGALFSSDMPEAGKAVNKANAIKKLELLNAFFGKNQFLYGSTYTPADAYCFVVVNWTKWLGIDMTPFKNILGFNERIAKRPAVQKVLQADTPK